MIEALFYQSIDVAAKKMLDFSVLRQEHFSSNLANAETPYSKRIDVAQSFASRLPKAIGSRNSSSIASLP